MSPNGVHGPLYWLQVSRPGLWFQTLWLYLLPTSSTDAWRSLPFWVGLVYVTFPLNLLVYGWNDRVDVALDRDNPRKGNFWFGAQSTAHQLKKLPRLIIFSQAPFWIWMALRDPSLLGWLAAIICVNACYNHPTRGWRSRPPLELVNILGYLILLPMSSHLNQSAQVPLTTLVYLGFFCLQAHLMGEIMDIQPDRAHGRETTATRLGQSITKLIVIALVGFEGAFLIWQFDEWLLGVFMWMGVLWLLFDYVRFPSYRPKHFRWFAWGMNVSGYVSIAWVWWRGSLMA